MDWTYEENEQRKIDQENLYIRSGGRSERDQGGGQIE